MSRRDLWEGDCAMPMESFKLCVRKLFARVGSPSAGDNVCIILHCIDRYVRDIHVRITLTAGCAFSAAERFGGRARPSQEDESPLSGRDMPRIASVSSSWTRGTLTQRLNGRMVRDGTPDETGLRTRLARHRGLSLLRRVGRVAGSLATSSAALPFPQPLADSPFHALEANEDRNVWNSVGLIQLDDQHTGSAAEWVLLEERRS